MTDWKKPDGSALDAQQAAIDERNAAARKIGRAERVKREDAQDKARRESEAKQSASLRRQSEGSGGGASRR
jgi:hypothetical protein